MKKSDRAMPKPVLFSTLILCFCFTSISHGEPLPEPEAPKTASTSTWDLSELYPDVESWNQHRLSIIDQIETLDDCKGKLGDSWKTLAKCLNKTSDTYKNLLRLYVYAFLSKDTDLGNSEFMERSSQSQALWARFGEAISYMEPEIIGIGERKLDKYIKKHPELEDHDFYIRNTLRRAAHVLSPEEERILAAASDALETASNTYDVLTNAEIKWPEITLSNGEKVTLNASGYGKYRAADSREDRKKVFDAFWGTYQDYRQTLAVTLEGQVKSHVLTARLRNYDSALEQALASDNIPQQVYRTLVTTVNENLDALHRMLALRQRMLGVEDSRYYDVYPAVISLNKEYTLEDAKAITQEALKPLGEEYVDKFRYAINQDWMHVYPSPGKRSGAYVMGAAYDVHPYMLLNHTDDIESLSTFAHEWGHAMHSLLANESQPFTKADYATFIAEIASTANEVLLFDYLRANAETDQEKLYVLFKELTQLRGTFFRQTQFAEFELAIHEEVENGGALSADKLSLMYGDILKRYAGHDQGVLTIDDTYTVEWAYIPHFYRNFYVYQYATSISAAYYLVDQIKGDGEAARQNFLNVLRAGGSDYPYNILLRAGVDMASPEVYQAIIHRMHQLMDEIESILDKTGDSVAYLDQANRQHGNN